MLEAFRSLKRRNYRLWAGGALVSNVGTWMQRIAQDWLVLTHLTDRNATAMGIVMALQFGPQLLMLPFTGYAADHFDRRRLLIATQSIMGALALGLGLLTLFGVVQLWHVYIFAFMLGCTAAFDAPARQTFVSELVGEADLSNAVALNSMSFNAGRLLGPAVAGSLIGAVGSGWAFIANAISFAAVIASLNLLRVADLHTGAKPKRARGSLVEGFGYVSRRADLKALLLILFLVGTFGLNYPIFISTMSVKVFHAGASQFGLLTSIMAIGSITGSLMAARRSRPGLAVVLAGCAIFGVGFLLAAISPAYWLFGVTLVVIGAAGQTITNTSIATVQLATDPAMRGRVMAILMAITVGGTLVGAPIVGWTADTFGPRWALGIGAAAGLCSVCIGIGYLVKYRSLRLRVEGRGLRFSLGDTAETGITPSA